LRSVYLNVKYRLQAKAGRMAAMLKDMGITAMKGTKWIGIAPGESRLDQGSTLVYFRKVFNVYKTGNLEICISTNSRNLRG
jgi:hypothetical protein